MTYSAYRFADLHQRLGIDLSRLGCIMLDVEPLDVADVIPEDWRYYSPTLRYCQGVPDEAHVTLLFGLLSNGNTIRRDVDEVLDGWEMPAEVTTNSISVFRSSNGEPYSCIVAAIYATPTLREAHGRLSLLPHIDTFPEYRPHVTLAYVRDEMTSDAVEALRRTIPTRDVFSIASLRVLGLNYGDPE